MPIEEAGARAADVLWFQLYRFPNEDHKLGKDLIRRADEAGAKVLVLTLDTPIRTTRTREVLAGITNPFRFLQNKYTLSDDIVMIKGNHTIKFGARFQREQINGYSYTYWNGNYTFNSLYDLMIGRPFLFTGAKDGEAYGNRNFRQIALAPYVQDDWRVTRRLTVNAGVRVEFNRHMEAVDNRLSTVDLNVPGGRFVIASDARGTLAPQASALLSAIPIPWVTSADAGWDASLLRPSYRRVAPRVGFAYRPPHLGETVVRGAFGIFLNQWAYSVQQAFESAELPASADGTPEGYLFPATYGIKRSATAGDIAKQMIARFRQAAAELELERRARAQQMTVHDVMTLASLLEGEAAPKDYAKVARVILNRLAKNMPLQLDSTVNYGMGADFLQLTNQQLLHASCSNDVVVLHERSVAERHPMIHTTAASHRVLLELPQKRRGLPGVTNPCRCAFEFLRPGASGRGHTRQMAEEVERCALADEQIASSPDCGEQYRAFRHIRAVLHMHLHGRVVIRLEIEHCCGYPDTGSCAVLSGHEVEGGTLLRGHGCDGGDVDASVEILGNRLQDEVCDLRGFQTLGCELLRDMRTQCHSSTPIVRYCSVPSGSIVVAMRTRQRRSSVFGKSSRQCEPRVSRRSVAPNAIALAAAWILVVSQAAVFITSAVAKVIESSTEFVIDSESADRSTPAPSVIVDWMTERWVALNRPAVLISSTGSRRSGSSRARSAAMRSANTNPSSNEFEASRFAPCTPVPATSPHAYRPDTVVRPRRSVCTPPEW